MSAAALSHAPSAASTPDRRPCESAAGSASAAAAATTTATAATTTTATTATATATTTAGRWGRRGRRGRTCGDDRGWGGDHRILEQRGEDSGSDRGRRCREVIARGLKLGERIA